MAYINTNWPNQGVGHGYKFQFMMTQLNCNICSLLQSSKQKLVYVHKVSVMLCNCQVSHTTRDYRQDLVQVTPPLHVAWSLCTVLRDSIPVFVTWWHAPLFPWPCHISSRKCNPPRDGTHFLVQRGNTDNIHLTLESRPLCALSEIDRPTVWSV